MVLKNVRIKAMKVKVKMVFFIFSLLFSGSESAFNFIVNSYDLYAILLNDFPIYDIFLKIASL